VSHAKPAEVDVEGAAERIRGVCERTPVVPFPVEDERVDLRLKLECLQHTNSFKARGAWNQLSRLTEDQRERGVCATSSGNHGRAVAWAARRSGVAATLFMPQDVYPNKLAACREEGAEIVLCETRAEAERRCAEAVRGGRVLIHPYADVRTIEGAGTVGLEIAQDWPEVEVCLFPVGGGGLIAGSSLALDTLLGEPVFVCGVEPEGAPNLTRALEVGAPVPIDPITTRVQGLCPIDVGVVNLELAELHVDGTITVSDEEIYAAQKRLLQAGWTVEPAGAASLAGLLSGGVPEELFEDRDASDPLRVVCVVSGGNPDPEQVRRLLAD